MSSLDKRGAAPVVDQWRLDLLAAADLLDRDGWCQGLYADYYGRHCAVGALRVIIDGRLLVASCLDRQRHLSEAVGHLAGLMGLASAPMSLDIVTGWNDHPKRTCLEVVKRMRDVARC